MSALSDKMTRIGIFYDGNFLFHVSNYYQYHHELRQRVSVGGLHAFLRDEVARLEQTDARYCQIVDAHYFRGRLRASEADDRDLLYRERVFDDVLVREGVTTHYLPLSRDGEKGIDVWLALEAYELTIYKRFDVVVLVACDGDFLPLVRKLNTLGARVAVLGWDFHYVDANNNERETRTAQVLLDEATYPIMMGPIIEDRSRRNDSLINGLFVPKKEYIAPQVPIVPIASGAELCGTILNLRNGYGFITPSGGGENIFFFHLDVNGADFLDLRIGDSVEFVAGLNERGPCARQVRVIRAPAVASQSPS